MTIPTTVFRGSGSALMGEGEMPEMSYEEISHAEGPSPTVVPFRNAVFLSLAVAFAASRRIDLVYIAVHAEDAHNWAYPDCTPEFLGPFGASVYVGTYRAVRLRYPFIWDSKTDIVRRAAVLGVPLGLTWSCYNPMAGGACGTCPTCIDRIHAFQEAGYEDPIVYHPGVKKGGATLWPVKT
jgi:7-cyano-7-deazaguanine synthase